MMTIGAFDTSGAMEAIDLGMPISFAFTALRNGSLWSRRLEFDFGVM